MRIIPAAMQAQLDTGATTHCTCWRLTRRDGTVLGFTDHDRDLTIEGTVYRAASGLSGSEARSAVGLSVDHAEIDGALISEALTAEELDAGVYDLAEIEVWRVDWADPSNRALLRVGELGEITRGSYGFGAEVRGLAHRLQQKRGRTYQHTCDADLGDHRCTVDLAAPGLTAAIEVLEVRSAREIVVAGLEAIETGWMTHGRLTWTSGAASGAIAEVRSHHRDGTGTVLALRLELARVPAVGDTALVTAGCDKRFATCRDKFSNAVSFRGFPHIPGADWIAVYPRTDGAARDGQPRHD